LEGVSKEDVGILYDHLVYFTANWYFLSPFGTLFPILVCCTKKNLATLSLKPSQKPQEKKKMALKQAASRPREKKSGLVYLCVQDWIHTIKTEKP
jgi:hypothetical protein